MKRIATVLLLSAIFSLIALYIIYPETIEKVWLWFVGLIGVIIALFQKAGNWIESQLQSPVVKKEEIKVKRIIDRPSQLAKIIRYSNTENKKQGLLYAEGKFLGFTEENYSLASGNYELTIRRNQLVAFEKNVSVLISVPAKAQQGDIVITGDQNRMQGSSELIYNALFEMVANKMEQDKQALLSITYADSSIPNIQ